MKSESACKGCKACHTKTMKDTAKDCKACHALNVKDSASKQSKPAKKTTKAPVKKTSTTKASATACKTRSKSNIEMC